MPLLCFVLGCVLGFVLCWLQLRSRAATALQLQSKLDGIQSDLVQARLEAVAATERREAAVAEVERLKQTIETQAAELRSGRERVTELQTQLTSANTTLSEQQKAHQAQVSALEAAEARLKDSFQALAAEALRGSTDEFLKLADAKLLQREQASAADLELRKQQVEALVKPLAETLDRFQDKIQDLETKREGAYSEIRTQIEGLRVTGSELKSEASRLVGALKMPQQRGRWGEIQMRRVVELAGMVRYCDFDEQVAVRDNEGNLCRPDMTVRLPGGRTIVVDSKVSLSAYLEAAALEDDVQRGAKLKEHAQQIRAHVARLANRSYWNQFDNTPEFVVAFIPGESFFSAALQQDPALIEFGAEHRVVLATPTTLIALLKSVAYGWRQEDVARNAQQISDLGKQLYERLATMYGHIADLGNSLDKAVKQYNKTLGALDSRVMVSARRFKELGAATGEEIAQREVIEVVPREPLLPESLRLRAVSASSVSEN